MRIKNIKLSHNTMTMLFMSLGIVTGLLNIPFFDETASIVAEITVRLMKLISVPLLFLSIVSSAAHFKNLHHIRVLGQKIVKYTILTTFLAAILAETLYFFAAPLLLGSRAHGLENSDSNSSSFLKTMLNMIPDNLAGAFLENNVLAVVLIAIALALAILTIKEQEKDIVFGFFSGILNAVMRIVQVGLKLIPISVWAFVTILTKQINSDDIGSLGAIGGLTITVIAANLVQGFVVLPLLLKFKKIKAWTLFLQVREALVLAFFTRSSTATLPATLEHSIKDAGISEDVARLSLPLCTTINMNGCAQFILLSVYFVSAYTGHPLMWWEHFGMIFLSVMAAIGNAGVPMGCFFLASSILASRDVPLHIMGSILPLYAFIDMVETSLNVWSDVCIAKIVDNESK